MNQGWIKIHRKILHSQMYKSLTSKQRDVMMACLLLANHDTNEWQWGSEVFKCEPGEFITSLTNIKDLCGKDIRVQSVRTALLKLMKWGFLTNESTKTGRRIKVLNWAKYQAPELERNKDTNKQPTKSQQRANKELTSNKNGKNVKNEKKDTTNVVLGASPQEPEYGNKRISQWLVPKQVVPKQVVPKQVVKDTQIGSQVVPKQVHTKETITKETIQKKSTYGEFKNCKLSITEYEKLGGKLGVARRDEYIDKLDLYVGSHGKKYKSHYLTILSWWKKDGSSVSFKPEKGKPVYW